MARRRRLIKNDEDHDPMAVLTNLFDVAMVFAVALMVALVTRFDMTEMFSQEDFTVVKNPGTEQMEIITKKGEKIEKYTPSEDQSGKNSRGNAWAPPTSSKTGKSSTSPNREMCNGERQGPGMFPGPCLSPHAPRTSPGRCSRNRRENTARKTGRCVPNPALSCYLCGRQSRPPDFAAGERIPTANRGKTGPDG